VATLQRAVQDIIATEPSMFVDYIEFRNSRTLAQLTTAAGDTLLALAVKIGSTRLIDNCILGEDS
jgi:pantoate--beta-alanine ligase